MHQYYEHHKRSLVKTITYRVLIIASNALVIWLFTGSLKDTATVIGWTSIVSTILYFIHERAWNHVHWGKSI